MKSISTVDELKEITESYPSGYLFRGQARHYADSAGETSITTSFSRKGCVPQQMQKWILYCEEILYYLKGKNFIERIELEECQALLQHYGWRSFFIDFTESIEVACWFASNVYREEIGSGIVEDWQENGLMVMHRNSNYDQWKQDGYLYIVDSAMLSKKEIGTHEIERFRFSDFDSRLDRQRAVMVGPIQALPSDTVVGQFKVANEVLRQMSSSLTVQELFPGRNEDLIYKLLLAAPFEVPRSVSGQLGNFGPYTRSIDVPEYDYEYKKRIDSSIAFYEPKYFFKLDDISNTVVVRVPDSFLAHVEVKLSGTIDAVLSLLGDCDNLVVEADGLICLPFYHDKSTYLKGSVLERLETGLVEISGLMVDHPGSVYKGIGSDVGWHYKIGSGTFDRFEHEDDCPCNLRRKHMLELSIIRKLQYAIENGLIKREGGYYHVRD